MKKVLKITLLIIFALSMFLSTYFSYNIKNAVYTALLFCGKSLIPSLLPMLFIVSLFSNCGLINTLPSKAANYFLFIISSVSGYPSSSKIFSKVNSSDPKLTERIIPATVCAGPAFIINFVGDSILNSKKLGILIYFSIVMSNFLIYIICGGTNKKMIYNDKMTDKNLLSISVKESIETMSNICGYIVLFSFLNEITTQCFGEKISKVTSYFVEVSYAVNSCNNIYLICAILSFGGICVMLQNFAICQNIRIKNIPYLMIRLTASILSVILLKISLLIFPVSVVTFADTEAETVISYGGSSAYFVTIILTLIALLISIKKTSCGNFLKDIDAM